MITAMISRLLILAFGTLYPAYASYKAVRTKDVKEYVNWMMYWIVFALFTCAETFTDIFFSFWFPFYYEIKVALVFWLLSPATKGSSFLYRNFVHPSLKRREADIDEMLNHAKERGYNTVLSIGSKGVTYATNVILQTAMRTVTQQSSMTDNGGIVDGASTSNFGLPSSISEDSLNAGNIVPPSNNPQTGVDDDDDGDDDEVPQPRSRRSRRTNKRDKRN